MKNQGEAMPETRETTVTSYVNVGPSICFECHAKQHPGSRTAIVYRLGLAAAERMKAERAVAAIRSLEGIERIEWADWMSRIDNAEAALRLAQDAHASCLSALSAFDAAQEGDKDG